MKFVLTGATGFVGSEVLTQLLARPDVERVTCLTRRPVDRAHPKLTNVVHADFSSYDAALLDQLADHEACLWTLGGKASDFPDAKGYEQVTHGFTLAFATAWAGRAPRAAFCYLSGMGADPTESARLPWERTTRHLKGRTERDLALLTRTNPRLTAYSFRPAGILPRHTGRMADLLLRPIAVRVDILVTAMIRVALAGATHRTLSNARIRAIGSA